MTTYYIKSSGGSDANAGTTTAGAFATISKGCIAAVAGDTVFCLTGTYNAAIYINTSNMKNGTTASPITLKSITPLAAKIMPLGAPATGGGNNSMLECRCNGWVIDSFEFDASSGYTHTTTYAWLLGGAGQYRQAVYISGLNCHITNNYAHHVCLADPGGNGGAGLQVDGAQQGYVSSFSSISFNIVHDVASSNTSNKVHGVYVSTKALVITGNLVYNQFGGMCIHGWHGFDGPTNISNNTTFNNTGAGILIGQGDSGGNTGGTPAPANVIIFNNIMRNNGTGVDMFHQTGSPPTGTNTVAYNHTFNCGTPYNVFSVTKRPQPGYSGDPLMVNYIQTGGGDYHLLAASTCVDLGVASLSGQNAPILDIDGVARPQSTKWDLGAYEFIVSGDTTAPSFVSAVVQDATPTIITITMDETLAASTPPTSAFTVAGKVVSSVVLSGAQVTITCSTPFVFGNVITVQYTKPGAAPWLKDAAGNTTASFGPNSVTNNVGVVSPPNPTPSVGPAIPSLDYFGGHERKFVFNYR